MLDVICPVCFRRTTETTTSSTCFRSNISTSNQPPNTCHVFFQTKMMTTTSSTCLGSNIGTETQLPKETIEKGIVVICPTLLQTMVTTTAPSTCLVRYIGTETEFPKRNNRKWKELLTWLVEFVNKYRWQFLPLVSPVKSAWNPNCQKRQSKTLKNVAW